MEILSSTVATVVYICMLVGPFLFVVLLYRNRKWLKQPEMTQRFGTLYEGLKQRKEIRVWFSGIIMLRIVLLVLAIVFYRNNSAVQLAMMLSVCMVSSGWMLFKMVNESVFLNTLMVMNEGALIIYSLLCYFFVF